ncbi:MAG: TIGR03915 family putative DNA repair protein, partial [Acidaminococcaceae bacterium]|nr:TIGR03915 family putative DNA repair protein [Acidaminococcaceae bacterium]
FRAVIPPVTPDLVYYYDGTWEGWLCCVYESYMAREIPGDVLADGTGTKTAEENLFYTKVIKHDMEKSNRVRIGIADKIGRGFLRILQLVFCSCIPHKEEEMLLFTHKGFRYGMGILNMRQDTVVKNVLKGLHELGREVDKWYGFVRFSDVKGILVAVIGAKNNVLPFIATHFCDRYRNEKFMIFDKNHNMALLYRRGERAIVPVEDFTLPDLSEDEKQYRVLWKSYYDAIEIKPRHNETCRRTHMPKRYWDFLTEMTERDNCVLK